MDRNIKSFMSFSECKVNESDITIKCDWAEECKKKVIEDLKRETGTDFSWEGLAKFVTFKHNLLGKEKSVTSLQLIEHISDLIFSYYGEMLYATGRYDNAMLHSQGVMINELAINILHSMLGEDDDLDTTIRLLDTNKECASQEEFNENKKSRVKNYREYNKMLNEAKTSLKLENYDEIVEQLIEMIDPNTTKEDILDFVTDYIRAHGRICTDGLEPSDAEIMIKIGITLWSEKITKEIMDTISSIR